MEHELEERLSHHDKRCMSYSPFVSFINNLTKLVKGAGDVAKASVKVTKGISEGKSLSSPPLYRHLHYNTVTYTTILWYVCIFICMYIYG